MLFIELAAADAWPVSSIYFSSYENTNLLVSSFVRSGLSAVLLSKEILATGAEAERMLVEKYMALIKCTLVIMNPTKTQGFF
jgi:hypothetical protein